MVKEQIMIVLKETNKLRAEKGLPPLRLNDSLSAYAQIRAEESATLFAHKRPGGGNLYAPIRGSGPKGENLAMNHSLSGVGVVKQWARSKGHYENMTKPQFTDIGIGLAITNARRVYWAQIFSGPGGTSIYRYR